MQDQGTALYISTRLFERAFILVFSMMLVLVLFYVVGNYQGFTDETQLQLLGILQAAAGIATVGALISFLLEMITLVLQRTLVTLVHLLLIVIAGIIAAGITLGSSGILVFLGPV